jgi:hypothetical protein
MTKQLRGWTLSETLVVMIIAGIVFLAVMDGMVLFGRFASRKTNEITRNMALYDGYYLLRHMAVSADGVSTTDGHLGLCREEVAIAELFIEDSLLVARRGTRTDTLMWGVSELGFTDSIHLTVYTAANDTLRITFPVTPAASRITIEKLREREKKYAYD